jgi:hypothetical protein
MTKEYYLKRCNTPEFKAIISWRNKRYREKNREKLNAKNREYGKIYRSLLKENK